MTKALILLSGGLDSMLADRLLMEQGVEVTGLSFKSYFFGTAKAKKVAERLGVKLIEMDFSEEHLAMVKNPQYGYGKNMNPCVDCHALMLGKAREIIENPPLNLPFTKGENVNGEYDFVATGEVLGERPMSQNQEALRLVEKIAGLKGRLIRPLSARLLDASDLEKTGRVDRSRLLDLNGRGRKRQLAMVKKYGIKEYSSPGGGCILTDPVFSEKLMKLMEYWPECSGNDIELLKHGRIYWLTLKTSKDAKGRQGGSRALVVVGRDQQDNENLLRFVQTGDILINMAEAAGPTSLIRIKNYELKITNETREIKVPQELKMSELKMDEGKNGEEIISLAALLASYYATKARGRKVKLEVRSKNL